MKSVRVLAPTWHHDLAEAERRAHDRVATANTTFWKDLASGDLASIEGAQGHLARSEADIREAQAVDESAGAMGMYFRRVAQLAQMDIRHQVRVSEALASLADARAKHPFGPIDPTERVYPQLAIAYALGGKLDEARSLMGEYARTVPPMVQKGDPDHYEALGNIALADGHFAEALKNFQQMRVGNVCVTCGMFEIAQSFTKLGQPDSALAYYQQYVSSGELAAHSGGRGPPGGGVSADGRAVRGEGRSQARGRLVREDARSVEERGSGAAADREGCEAEGGEAAGDAVVGRASEYSDARRSCELSRSPNDRDDRRDDREDHADDALRLVGAAGKDALEGEIRDSVKEHDCDHGVAGVVVDPHHDHARRHHVEASPCDPWCGLAGLHHGDDVPGRPDRAEHDARP